MLNFTPIPTKQYKQISHIFNLMEKNKVKEAVEAIHNFGDSQPAAFQMLMNKVTTEGFSLPQYWSACLTGTFSQFVTKEIITDVMDHYYYLSNSENFNVELKKELDEFIINLAKSDKCYAEVGALFFEPFFPYIEGLEKLISLKPTFSWDTDKDIYKMFSNLLTPIEELLPSHPTVFNFGESKIQKTFIIGQNCPFGKKSKPSVTSQDTEILVDNEPPLSFLYMDI